MTVAIIVEGDEVGCCIRFLLMHNDMLYMK